MLSLILGLLIPGAASQAQEIPLYKVDVVKSFPHDPEAFTQGLEMEAGVLYEGTGLKGESSLRRVDLESGEVLQLHNLAGRYFGEGITVLGSKIYQLTWRAQLGFVYDRDSFKRLETFHLPGEGWGLTDDGERLIVSDGTPFLRFLDPQTFKEVRRLQVHDDRGPVKDINELEFINGEVWANIWMRDILLRIDPDSGAVTGKVDISGLRPFSVRRNRDAVANGIAWDAGGQRLFITGKHWPKLYQIRLRGDSHVAAENPDVER